MPVRRFFPRKSIVRLREFDRAGLLSAALTVIFEFEGDLIAFVQAADASALESGGVHKNDLGAVGRLDKAETFGAIVEFLCAGDASHDDASPFP